MSVEITGLWIVSVRPPSFPAVAAALVQETGRGKFTYNPKTSALINPVPITSGTNIMVQTGNSCFTKCARMILVVILPKTKLMVTQKRTKWLSTKIPEFLLPTHVMHAMVKVAIPINSLPILKTAWPRERFSQTTL